MGLSWSWCTKNVEAVLLSRIIAPISLVVLLSVSACNAKENRNEIIYVGSTPCDNELKSALTIPAEIQVDFIRWELKLFRNTPANDFELNIHYGEAKQGTNGFINDGFRNSLKGVYSFITESVNKIIRLKSPTRNRDLAFLVIDENLVHLLDGRDRLMVGNGGWNYTLSLTNPVESRSTGSNFRSFPVTALDSANRLTFQGRTPCQELGSDHPELKANKDCNKIKWLLTLFKDSTLSPTVYTLRKVVKNKPLESKGKWNIRKAEENEKTPYIIQLDPDRPGETIYFLAADENILLVIDRNLNFYPGNSDFSYTLNRIH